MDLWSNHRQYSPPLLQHQYGQFRAPPQLGPIASSRSTCTHLHATSEPSTDTALDTSTSRKPTHTTTASGNASDWTAHHPTTHSTAATGLADQRNSSSPWSSTSDQIWTGNTPATNVQGLCFFLGGARKEKSRPLFASIIFFFLVVFGLFIFFFLRKGDITLYHVTVVALFAFHCSVIQHSGWTCSVVCAINIQHGRYVSFVLRRTWSHTVNTSRRTGLSLKATCARLKARLFFLLHCNECCSNSCHKQFQVHNSFFNPI